MKYNNPAFATRVNYDPIPCRIAFNNNNKSTVNWKSIMKELRSISQAVKRIVQHMPYFGIYIKLCWCRTEIKATDFGAMSFLTVFCDRESIN